MNVNYSNFIGVYSDVYPEGYCQHLISEFDRMEATGAGASRVQSEGAKRHIKNDYQMNVSLRGQELARFKDHGLVDIFFDGLQVCYEDYIGQFSTLGEGKVRATTVKMQRTGPGGGYHIWHAEQGNGEFANRVLVYMLYLNTLEPNEGGETEFLYQKERYRPVENTMVLWPAAFTHTHRGNTVLGEKSKYIVTGWFYYD